MNTEISPVTFVPDDVKSIRRTERHIKIADEGSFTVIASKREELVEAQGRLTDWSMAKMEAANEELEHASTVLAQVKAASLDTRAAVRMRRTAFRRAIYFEKLHAAIGAGYTLLPPMNDGARTIAIRVEGEPARDFDPQNKQRSHHGTPALISYAPQTLPRFEGQMVAPEPEQSIVRWEEKDPKTGEMQKWVGRECRGKWRAPELPAELCKPRIIESMDKAIGLGVFDQLCVVGISSKRRPDPILCGLVHHHSVTKTYRWEPPKSAWFLLAWWIDTDSLA